jgi:hypothetical protein
VSEWGGYAVLLVLVVFLVVGLWAKARRFWSRPLAGLLEVAPPQADRPAPPPVELNLGRPFDSLPKGPLPAVALPPERITCPRCLQTATAWRTYADGRRECLLCTLRKRKP